MVLGMDPTTAPTTTPTTAARTPGPAPTPTLSLSGSIGGGTAGSGSAYYAEPNDPKDPPVWVGSIFGSAPRLGANKPLPGGGRLPGRQVTEHEATMPLSQAELYVRNLDADTLQKMTEKAWYWGYDKVSAPDDIMGFIALWQDAVNEAAAFQAAGKRLSPMQVLELGATGNVKNRADRAFAGGMQTQKSRKIQLTDPVSAKALIRQAFQTAFGRDPTDAEVRTLAGSLTAAEKAHPQVTVDQASFDAAGNPTGTPTETVSGGIDPGAFLQEQVQDDPEAKEFQAAGTYFPALMQLMGSAYGL